MRIYPLVIRWLVIAGAVFLAPLLVSANIELIKSPNDATEYEALVLPNQMKVLLVSDPETDKAAAALAVSVGAANDPVDRGGVAHFLEHMLFLGTEKYPEPDEYQGFIRANGGSNNAFTSFEFTTYYFDINASLLDPALDRFAQFFTAPLFNPKYVEREKHSVESEYRTRLKDDARRRIYAQKDIANPRHPFANFQSGNLETLQDDARGSIRDALLDFYAENYSANLMALAVVGKQPLAELKSMVVERFSAVPNTGAARLQINEPLFEPGRLPARLDVIPNKEQRSVSMMFPIPSMREHYLAKPTAYLGHLLGHEGKGSLLSLLKNKGWADSLSAGGGLSTPGSATFSIFVALTEEGLENIDGITGHVFEQLRQIRQDGVNHWTFEEQKKLNELDFRFREKSEPAGYAVQLASDLHIYPMEDVLRGPYALDVYDPDVVHEVLEHLTPENVLVTVIAKGQETTHVTRWFDTPYALNPIGQTTLARWRTETIDEQLSLPEPNPFVPENLELKPGVDSSPIPVRIKGLQGLDVWYQHETRFGTPRADFFVSVRSELAKSSAANAVMTGLYTALVNDQLTEFAYPGILAGLGYQLYPHIRGFSIRISGYSDKQVLLLKRLIETLGNPVIDAERFAIIKERQLRRLRSVRLDRPYAQTMAELSRLMVDPSWTEDQQIAALETLDADDLRTFTPKLLAQMSVVALAHGNLLREDVSELAAVVKDGLLRGVEPSPEPRSRVVALTPGASFVRDLEVDHSDSAVTLYFQGEDKSMQSRARSSLIVQILSSPFYADLRTEKQLGYIVFATRSTMLEVPGISFVIQSPVVNPGELVVQIEAFLQTQHESLRNMSAQQFETYRNGLLTRILDEDKTLVEVSDRYWTEIDRHHYEFDTRERMAEAVRSIKKEELVAFYERVVLSDLRKRLLVRTVGNNHRDTFIPDDAGTTVIPNTERFQRGKTFFPPGAPGSG